MTWQYKGKPAQEIPEGYVGFVYQITNNKTGKKYIGKKLVEFKKSRPPLKGRKNRRRYKVESDWREYYGSSDALTEDVKQLGQENFLREILFEGKAGLLVKPKSINSWEKNLKKLIKDSSYRNKLAQKLGDLVLVYDSKVIALQWEKLLKEEITKI